jgi:hypothetical protein
LLTAKESSIVGDFISDLGIEIHKNKVYKSVPTLFGEMGFA